MNISFEYLVSMSLLGVGYMLTPFGLVPQRIGNTCLLIHVSISMKPCFGSLIRDKPVLLGCDLGWFGSNKTGLNFLLLLLQLCSVESHKLFASIEAVIHSNRKYCICQHNYLLLRNCLVSTFFLFFVLLCFGSKLRQLWSNHANVYSVIIVHLLSQFGSSWRHFPNQPSSWKVSCTYPR
jgi:hypothetical protein